MAQWIEDLVLLAVAWVTSVVWVRTLAQELLHVVGAAKKKKKKKKKKVRMQQFLSFLFQRLPTLGCVKIWFGFYLIKEEINAASFKCL